MIDLIIIFFGILASSFISTVAGLGAALIILPLFVFYLGPAPTVVALTICMIWGNINKVILFRRYVEKRIVLYMIAGGVPAALTGAYILPFVNPILIKKLMGILLLFFIITRIFQNRITWKVQMRHFPFIGICTGLVSGLVGAAGPVNGPFYLNHGLVKERFNGTNAATALILHVAKLIIYHHNQMVTLPILTVVGVSVGAITVGTILGKKVLTYFSSRVFEILLLCILGIIAVQFLFFA